MTQDEIIRMAREAGLIQYVQVEKTCVSNALERFAALVAAHEREKQAEQELVAYLVTGPYEKHAFADIGSAEAYCRWLNKGFGEPVYVVSPLYAAPVRTKDLTDEELNDIWYGNTKDGWLGLFRAVIAADRELNK